MANLTAKQEQFAHLVANGMAYNAAYREAYNPDTMSEKHVNNKASELANRGDIGGRIAQIQADIREKLMVSKESVTRELEEARLVAAAKEQGAAMVSASMGKAKLHGLLVETHDVNHKGSVSVGPMPWDNMYGEGKDEGDAKPQSS